MHVATELMLSKIKKPTMAPTTKPRSIVFSALEIASGRGSFEESSEDMDLLFSET